VRSKSSKRAVHVPPLPTTWGTWEFGYLLPRKILPAVWARGTSISGRGQNLEAVLSPNQMRCAGFQEVKHGHDQHWTKPQSGKLDCRRADITGIQFSICGLILTSICFNISTGRIVWCSFFLWLMRFKQSVLMMMIILRYF